MEYFFGRAYFRKEGDKYVNCQAIPLRSSVYWAVALDGTWVYCGLHTEIEFFIHRDEVPKELLLLTLIGN